MKSFVTLAQSLRLLLLDSGGTLWKESPQGTLASVAAGLALNAYGKSTTLFGREYLALSDGKNGNDMPRQFDDTNFDRVSQVGPGAAPAASDLIEINFAISTITRTSNVVTVTQVNPATGLDARLVGQQIVIAGVTGGATAFNGTFTILAVTSTTVFTYAQTGPNESGTAGTGTATIQGNISAGVHQAVVIFKTRQGYLTAPSPPVSWTAAGSKRVSVSSIPTGPPNVVARIIAFTASAAGSFFYLSTTAPTPSYTFIINDNTTTNTVFDFTDSALLGGTSVDYLFRLIELGECAGVIDYAFRLFWWGERNKLNNLLNPTFDGGFVGAVPGGWTADGTFGAGGSKDTGNAAWGDAYRITGDGATATRGLITQGAVKDVNGVPIILPNTDYSVRARVLKGGGLAAGTLHVHLFGTGVNTTGLQVTAAQAGAAYAEFVAQLTPAIATPPADLVLRVFADGTPTNNGFFVIDNIEVFPTLQPNNLTIVRASRNSDPESYDGISGLLQVSPFDGQAVRCAFRLRERLYLVKERSLYVTEDDGVNEPSGWSIREVSRVIGTPSIHGVAVGEDWVVIANRQGLYLFGGTGEPTKISQEIQSNQSLSTLQFYWDNINWQFGHTLWTLVDPKNKRILVGAPFGAATSPNGVLYLDYRPLESADAIINSPPIHISFGGKVISLEKSRKWAPWSMSINSAALVERTDGTAQTFLGNGAGNGKVYQLSDTQFSDDGVPINSFYSSFFLLGHELEQALQLGSHRKLFTYLTEYVEGVGTLVHTGYRDSLSTAIPLASVSLVNPSARDNEQTLNLDAERAAFQVGTNAVGSWFKLQKFIASVRPHPIPVRGAV